MKPRLRSILLLAVLTGCDRSDSPRPTPSPTGPTSPPVATAAVTALAVRGNAALTAVGETSALTATASLSDGTTKDVTTAVQWASSDPSSITVTPAGLLTVVRFGQSYVRATYQSKVSSLSVQATPPGTFVVWGRVREPGNSGLAGVEVREESSGMAVASGPGGEFSFGGLTGARLTFDKAGYERAALESPPSVFVDAAMQRVIRIAAGAGVDVGLAPHDVSYAAAADSRCYPCKMIRVVSTETGRLQLKAAWNERRATLNLWVNGRLFEGAAMGTAEAVADVPVGPGEVLVYVGMKNAVEFYAPFTLTTAVVK